MTIPEEAPRLKDEEVLPLMHTLQLERSSSTGSSSKQHKQPPMSTRERIQALLKGFTPELLAISLVYFVQGILKLSSLAVTFFLKDNLKMEPTQLALAETITALPWTIKPLYGFITDSFPICGMRRRPYLVLAGLLGTLSWLCMAVIANSVPTTLAFITAAALSTAFSDVVADSIVVQLARASPGATEGALQSMCWSAHAVGRVITSYLSGWLVGQMGPRPVFMATATFPLIVCASSCLIKEGNSKHSTAQHASAADTPQEQQQLLLAGEAAEGHPGTEGGSSAFSPVTAEAGFEPVTSVLPERHSNGILSRQGSAEVLQCQLQLVQGHLQHMHRHTAAMQQQHDSPHSTPIYAPASAAAAAAAAGGGGGPSTSSSTAAATDDHDGLLLLGPTGLPGAVSGRSSGNSKQRQRRCGRQVLTNMLTSVKLFWGAIKQPHMLRPVVFLFLLQAMPQPDSAMLFYKINELGFSAEVLGRIKLVAALADLAGLAMYNAFLKRVRLRRLLLWGGLLGCAVGLTPLLLVEGVNRKLGISDKLFALVDSALLASIGQVLMMPTLVLCARLCPEGVEATLYASLMSMNNAAIGTSALLGALLTKLFGITSHNFSHLSVLLLTCNLMSLLPLPLVKWVPDSTHQQATAATAATAAAAAVSTTADDGGGAQGAETGGGVSGGGSGSREPDMELGMAASRV